MGKWRDAAIVRCFEFNSAQEIVLISIAFEFTVELLRRSLEMSLGIHLQSHMPVEVSLVSHVDAVLSGTVGVDSQCVDVRAVKRISGKELILRLVRGLPGRERSAARNQESHEEQFSHIEDSPCWKVG